MGKFTQKPAALQRDEAEAAPIFVSVEHWRARQDETGHSYVIVISTLSKAYWCSPIERIRSASASTSHKARNLIERFFNKIKHFRRIATRYDKLAENFLAALKLAAVRIWLR